MPTVPSYQSQVRTQALPDAKLTATPGVEGFGGGAPLANAARANANLAEAQGDVAKPIGAIAKQGMELGLEIAIEEKRKNDELRVSDADTEAAKKETELQLEVNSMRGEDALKAPDVVQEKWTKSLGEIRKRLTNDAQKQAFERSAAHRSQSLNKTTSFHVSNESEKLADTKFKGAIDAAKNAAALNWGDVDRVELELARVEDALVKWAKRRGIPAGSEPFQLELTKELSSTHKSVIGAMISNGQDIRAKEYLMAAEESGELTPDDLADLTKSVRHSTILERSQQLAQEITGKYGNIGDAMKALDKIKDPEIQEKTKDLVKERFSMLETGKKQRKEAIYESFAKELEKSGDLASIQRNPRWMDLEDSQQAALLNRYDRKTKGIDRKNDDNKYVEFIGLSQGQLATMSSSEYDVRYRQHFSNDFQSKADSQFLSAKKGDEKNQLTSPFSSYKDQFDSTLGARGVMDAKNAKRSEAETKLYDQLAIVIRAKVEQYEVTELQGKRRASTQEIQKVIDDLVIKKVYIEKSWSSDPEKLVDVLTDDEKQQAYVPFDKVPQEERSAIENLFKQRNKKPSKSQIEKAYGAVLTKDKKRLQSILSE